TPGNEGGLPYLDLIFNSVASATFDYPQLRPVTPGGPPRQGSCVSASNGQRWTLSAYVRKVSGTLPGGTSVLLGLYEMDDNFNILSTYDSIITPTISPLNTQRFSSTFTTSNASTTNICPFFALKVPVGINPSNVTFRLAGMQLEIGSTPTRYDATTPTEIILTSGATWSVPVDWKNSHNWIHLIGPGGNGSLRAGAGIGGKGGGGGAYTLKRNIKLNPTANATISIGMGGTGASTTFNFPATGVSLTANGGQNSGSGGVAGATGDKNYSGGNGYIVGSGAAGGGGGGAAGPRGNGLSSFGTGGGGTAIMGGGAAGTMGSAGTDIGPTVGAGSGAGGSTGSGVGFMGGSYGAGGSGAGGSGASMAGGNGANGIIFILYVTHTGGH
ncbi:MAG: hypothetical protein V4736_06240, partial [Bdellovibrionota bacterium]